MGKTIRLTEEQFAHLVQESVKHTLNELDWRTYQSAADKAKAEVDSPDTNAYKKLLRARQGSKFQDKAIDQFDKQYGIDAIKKKREEARQRGERYEETNGDLRRLSKSSDDSENYYSGKSKYENGKWA